LARFILSGSVGCYPLSEKIGSGKLDRTAHAGLVIPRQILGFHAKILGFRATPSCTPLPLGPGSRRSDLLSGLFTMKNSFYSTPRRKCRTANGLRLSQILSTENFNRPARQKRRAFFTLSDV
jgi:hypothetical protein